MFRSHVQTHRRSANAFPKHSGVQWVSLALPLACFALLAFAVTGRAETIECGPECIIADAGVWSAHPAQNYGSFSYLPVGVEAPGIWKTYVKFNLECCSIPAGVTIEAATLSMIATQVSGDPPHHIFVTTVFEPWDEYTITENNDPGPGTPLDEDDLLANGSIVLDVGIAIQQWYANPADNHGFCLLSADDVCHFPSRENSGWDEYKPRLTIVYSGGGVDLLCRMDPQPASGEPDPPYDINQTITFELAVENHGSEPSQACLVGFYISADPSYFPEHPICTDNLGPLNPTQGDVVRCDVRIDVPEEGWYYVNTWIDRAGVNDDQDPENNKCSSTPFFVNIPYLDQDKLGRPPSSDHFWLWIDSDDEPNHDPGEDYYTSDGPGRLALIDQSCWMASAVNLIEYETDDNDYAEWLQFGGAPSPSTGHWGDVHVATGGGAFMTFDDGGDVFWALQHGGQPFCGPIFTATSVGGAWNAEPISWCQARLDEDHPIALGLYGDFGGGSNGHYITLWHIDTEEMTVHVTDSDDEHVGPLRYAYHRDGQDWIIDDMYTDIDATVVCAVSSSSPGEHLPDLLVEEIDWSPAQPQPDDMVTVTVRVRNSGECLAPSSLARLRVDSQPACDLPTPELHVGAATELTCEIGPLSSGIHTVEACANDDGAIQESSIANNCRSEPLEIPGEPDVEPPLFGDGACQPGSGLAGTLFTLTIRIEDPGSGVDPTTVLATVEHPDETPVCEIPLYDDGVSGGDVTAGDNIYTGQVDSEDYEEGTYWVDVRACDLTVPTPNCGEENNAVTFLVLPWEAWVEDFEDPVSFPSTWNTFDGTTVVEPGGFGYGDYWAHGHGTVDENPSMILNSPESLEWSDYDLTADLMFNSNDLYCYALVYFYLQSSTAFENHLPPDGYVLTLKAQQNVVELAHRVGGAIQSIVASVPYTINPGVPYHVEVMLDSPDIDVLVNGQPVIEVEHAGYSSGTIGFGGRTGGGSSRYIDWYCDNIQAVGVGDGQPEFVRGDVDASGELNISDPIYSLAYQFAGQSPPPCLDAADADDSGEVNISDAVYALAFQFAGGGAPPAPYPDCGPDPTADATECGSFPPCQPAPRGRALAPAFLERSAAVLERSAPLPLGSSAASAVATGNSVFLRPTQHASREVVLVDLGVETSQDLVGFECTVAFDPSVLRFENLDPLPGVDLDFLSANSETGSNVVRVGGVPDLTLQSPLQPGVRFVGVLRFRVLSPVSLGSQPLDIVSARLVFSGITTLVLDGGDGCNLTTAPPDAASILPDTPGAGLGAAPCLQVPSPYRANGAIQLSIPCESRVEVAVFDVSGRRVRTLYNDGLRSGELLLHWDGTTDDGRMAHTGVYYLNAKVGDIGVRRGILLVE